MGSCAHFEPLAPHAKIAADQPAERVMSANWWVSRKNGNEAAGPHQCLQSQGWLLFCAEELLLFGRTLPAVLDTSSRLLCHTCPRNRLSFLSPAQAGWTCYTLTNCGQVCSARCTESNAHVKIKELALVTVSRANRCAVSPATHARHCCHLLFHRTNC